MIFAAAFEVTVAQHDTRRALAKFVTTQLLTGIHIERIAQVENFAAGCRVGQQLRHVDASYQRATRKAHELGDAEDVARLLDALLVLRRRSHQSHKLQTCSFLIAPCTRRAQTFTCL